MKFDKETVIVLVIAFAIIVGWSIFYPKYMQSQALKNQQAQEALLNNELAKKAQQAENSQTATAVQNGNQPVVNTTAPDTTQKATVKEEPQKQADQPAAAQKPTNATPAENNGKKFDISSCKDRFQVLENDCVSLTFDSCTGTLVSANLKKYRRNYDSAEGDNIIIRPEGESKQTFYVKEFSGDLIQAPIVKKSENTLEITRVLQQYTVKESFTLQKDGYQLDVSYAVKNNSAADVTLPEITFWAAGLAPMRFMTDDKSNTPRHNIDYCIAKSEKVVSIEPEYDEPEKLTEKSTADGISWVASSNKYFVSFLLAKDSSTFNGGTEFSQVVEKKGNESYAVPSIGGKIKSAVLKQGSETSFEMSYYCGPKELKLLDALPVDNATEVMHVGYWSWFEFIARPLARFLVWIHKFIGNYGICIILLTLLIRGILWPITQKSTNSMRKMQKIQPKMTALREKYKDNPQELNARMMELYREEGVNPLGGCLPMILQMPIFFALYSVFDAAIEMRHQSFLWASDLAQPDRIGPIFNVLGFQLALHPFIIMQTILMFVQMKISQSNSKNTDNPQQKTQQRMMMFMPIIMLVMLYWLPSGLTLYWTISNAISLIQTIYSQHLAKLEDEGEKLATSKK